MMTKNEYAMIASAMMAASGGKPDQIQGLEVTRAMVTFFACMNDDLYDEWKKAFGDQDGLFFRNPGVSYLFPAFLNLVYPDTKCIAKASTRVSAIPTKEPELIEKFHGNIVVNMNDPTASYDLMHQRRVAIIKDTQRYDDLVMLGEFICGMMWRGFLDTFKAEDMKTPSNTVGSPVLAWLLTWMQNPRDNPMPQAWITRNIQRAGWMHWFSKPYGIGEWTDHFARNAKLKFMTSGASAYNKFNKPDPPPTLKPVTDLEELSDEELALALAGAW